VRTPFTTWSVGGGVITGMMPFWVVKYGTLKMAIITTVIALVVMALPKILGCWFPLEKAEQNCSQ